MNVITIYAEGVEVVQNDCPVYVFAWVAWTARDGLLASPFPGLPLLVSFDRGEQWQGREGHRVKRRWG